MKYLNILHQLINLTSIHLYCINFLQLTITIIQFIQQDEDVYYFFHPSSKFIQFNFQFYINMIVVENVIYELYSIKNSSISFGSMTEITSFN